MKLQLTEYDLKTLEQEKDNTWTYVVQTSSGNIKGSNLPSKEEAIKHAENNVMILIKRMLKK